MISWFLVRAGNGPQPGFHLLLVLWEGVNGDGLGSLVRFVAGAATGSCAFSTRLGYCRCGRQGQCGRRGRRGRRGQRLLSSVSVGVV
jgi:hypothetical protein